MSPPVAEIPESSSEEVLMRFKDGACLKAVPQIYRAELNAGGGLPNCDNITTNKDRDFVCFTSPNRELPLDRVLEGCLVSPRGAHLASRTARFWLCASLSARLASAWMGRWARRGP